MKPLFTSLRRLQPQRTITYWCRFSAILLISISWSSHTFAQNIQWDRTIGADDNDYFKSAQQTSDGGYILGGNSGSGKNNDKSQARKGQADYWIVKLNADGSKAWDKTIGGNKSDFLQSVHQTQDGGYLLGGTSSSDISGDKTEAQIGFWIVKLNAAGTKIWDKTIAGSFKTLQITSDGGYLLGGTTSNGYIPGDYLLLKLNADGSKAWEKAFGGSGNDALTSAQQTDDGGYILGGYSNSDISGDKTEATIGYWLVKLNADRTKAWDKTIEVKDYGDEFPTAEINALQQTDDGGYILGGYSSAKINAYKSEPSKGSSDYWLIKLKADGSKDWDKIIGGSNSDRLNALQPTQDGGYILGGNSHSNSSGDKTQNNVGSTDYWVVKLNADRSLAWNLTLGGNDRDDLVTVFQTKEGGYFAGGYSISGISGSKTQASKGQNDYWIVKLDNSTRKKQTVTFESIPEVNYSAQKTVTLKATTSSGLPASFAIVSGPATLNGNKLMLTGGSGTVTVLASQAGNEAYLAAQNDTTRFIVQVPPVTRLWEKAYGGVPTEYYDQYTKYFGSATLSAMVATPDGGYLLGGTSNSNQGNDKTAPLRGKTDYWVVKINAAGKKLWDKTYGGSNDDGLTALIATPDGGYLLGGTSRSGKSSGKSEASKGERDYWLVKIDAEGNQLWNKTLGGSNKDALSALMATPDGGYLLGGISESGISGDKSEASRDKASTIYKGDYWVVKVDGQGNKLWDKTLGGSLGDGLTALVTTPEGGYLVGGFSPSGISGDKSEASRDDPEFYWKDDYWVVKLDAAGKKVWDKTLGGNQYDKLSAIVATPDGGYLLGGSSASDKSGDKSQSSKGTVDYWLVKIDGTGTKLWDKTFGGNSADDLTALITTPDGGYLLGGNSASDISGDKSEFRRVGMYDNGSYDYWIVKVDAEANKIWDRTVGTASYYDQLTSLLATPEGNYLIGGSTDAGISFDQSQFTDAGISYDKSQPLKGVRDFWIIKLKEELTPVASAWDMRYGSSGNDNFTSAIKTSDGGYLSGGYTNSGSSGDKTQAGWGKNDYWIVKSDKNGKKLWNKRYGGNGDDYLNRVIQTQDGGYLLGGSSLSGAGADKSQGSQGDRDYWVVKVDKQGNQQWDKRFGGSGYDELKKIIQLASGEYVLGGYSNSPISGDKTQNSQGGNDYWLVKISATGTKIWDKRYGSNHHETLGSFTSTSDGGFLLGGSSLSGASGDKSQPGRGNSDYWLVKTDNNGNLLWDKTFGGSGKDVAYSISRSGKDYFIAGTSTSGANGDKSQSSRGGQDYWLIKLDVSGQKIWDKTYGGSAHDELRASTFTDAGNYVLAGKSFSGASGDKTQSSQGNSDYWIVQVDKAGNKLYDQRFGGSGAEELRTVFQTNDGGLLLGGRSDSNVSGDRTQPNQGGTDYWLVKLAPVAGSLVAAREASPLEAAVPVEPVNLQSYPNPFGERATIRFTLPQTQKATVKVYDSQGREIATLFQGEAKANHTYQVEWQAGRKATGMYLLQLQTSTQRHQQKLLLAK